MSDTLEMPHRVKTRFDQVVRHPGRKTKLEEGDRALIYCYRQEWEGDTRASERFRDAFVTRMWKKLYLGE
mgnify:CR=1 FL=1